MKRLIVGLLLLCMLSPAVADAPVFEAPDGWREEVIALPPDFAPEMSWKGAEVLRFSPGMFKPEEEDFFSYVFLLELSQGLPDWNTQLMLYYEGLAKSVMGNPNLDTSGFELQLSGRPGAFQGTLSWVEPFVTKKPQILYLETRKIGPKLWFVCVSPQKPDRPIWTEMRTIRNNL